MRPGYWKCGVGPGRQNFISSRTSHETSRREALAGDFKHVGGISVRYAAVQLRQGIIGHTRYVDRFLVIIPDTNLGQTALYTLHH